MLAALSAAAAILSFISVVLHFSHDFKLDGIAAAKLDGIADAAVARAKATADTGDDGMAAAEAALLHAIAGAIRDGKVADGAAALQALAASKAAKA